ncbi:MAG: putative capsular polysaccharide synthesis family protein [Acidobacteriota bacterium]
MPEEKNGRHVTVLYQMGKVGSTSVHAALLDAQLDTPVYKVHFLSDPGIAHGEKFHRSTLKNPWEETPHIKTTRTVRDAMAADPDLRLDVVTLVRDPVRREVSEFFQYVEALHPELLDDDGRLKTERAARFLQARFMFFDEASNYTCRWFDMEIKALFGLDVFAFPFDHAKGYTLIEQGHVRLLVLRLEDLDRTLNPGLRALVGERYQDWKGRDGKDRANVGAHKKSGDQYRELVANFQLRRSVGEKVYGSTYARHFYTPAEREGFLDKWTRP